MASAPHEFGAPLIGQTERSLKAILGRQLDGAGIDESGWVTLNLAMSGSSDRRELASRSATTLKADVATVEDLVDDLVGRHLLVTVGSEVAVSEVGRTLHAEVREALVAVTGRLWGDLPADDLAVAGRVLRTVLDRANAEISIG